MNRKGMYSLLRTTFTQNVFPDFIPEDRVTTSLPGVVYDHVSNNRDRNLEGNSDGKSDTWQITLLGRDRSETQTLLDLIETLDNTSDASFSNIFIVSFTDDPVTEDDPYHRITVDIKTYDRRQ